MITGRPSRRAFGLRKRIGDRVAAHRRQGHADGRMPETIEHYYARIVAASDDEGRLATNAEIHTWEIFPSESAGLRLKPLEALAQAEAPSHGEDRKDASRGRQVGSATAPAHPEVART